MLLTKRRTVHGTSSLHKIVGFINQKQIFLLRPLPEKPLQMGVRIEDVVIIADHRIHPNREIQRHLKRTDRMLSGICLDLIPAHIINMGEHVKDRIVDPVKMPLGVDAGIRITLGLLTETDLFLRCQSNDLVGEPLLFQGKKSLLRHCPCNCLCSQVEDLIGKSLPDSFHRGKHRSNGLPYSCRRLDKELFLSQNGTVN